MVGSKMQAEDLVPHEIAARNLLLGASRFLTLWLTPDWDLAPGVGRPEIVASHERAGVKWVASGSAWYVLYHRETGWAMELRMDVRHPRKDNRLQTGELLLIDGHEAQVRWWERGRGVFRRKRITYMEVAYNCPRSERFVRLEFSGRCGEEGFREILGLVPHWRCH